MGRTTEALCDHNNLLLGSIGGNNVVLVVMIFDKNSHEPVSTSREVINTFNTLSPVTDMNKDKIWSLVSNSSLESLQFRKSV